MKPYTVLLLYPDYLSETYGKETYQAWVKATNPKNAISAARREVLRKNSSPAGSSKEDFFVLAVFEGHLQNHAFDGRTI